MVPALRTRVKALVRNDTFPAAPTPATAALPITATKYMSTNSHSMKVIVLAKIGTARLTMWPAIEPLVKSVIGMPRPDIPNDDRIQTSRQVYRSRQYDTARRDNSRRTQLSG